MNLKQLLCGINAKVYGKVLPIEVRGLTRDSRCVGVGDVFIARCGKLFDGNAFSRLAVDNGAIAVVSSLYNPFLPVVQVVAKDINALEASLSAKFYSNPSESLDVIGITGTNGKTTTSHLIHYLLECEGRESGLIGTIEHVLGGNRVSDCFTTPVPSLLQKYLAEMVKNGLQTATMEVSSIGLELERVSHVKFKVGVFTNVSQDHLDFHETFDRYVLAKQKLFRMLSEDGLAVVNQDSEYVCHFVRSTLARVVTYGLDSASDYRAVNVRLSRDYAEYDLLYQGQLVPCCSPLIGRYNVYNVLAAVATVHQYLSCDLESLVKEIAKAQAPKGRLELISGPCPIYIDYAHTPDALCNVCKTLYELLPKEGRLIVVFGCGGDRERSKRVLMAQVVEQYGFAVVTSDNPRTEEPSAIIKEICAGFVSQNFIAEIDRRKAIQLALGLATDKDIVLVAGKGHEAYQVFKHQTIAFDDKQVVQEAF